MYVRKHQGLACSMHLPQWSHMIRTHNERRTRQSFKALVGKETMEEMSNWLGGGLTLTKLMLTRLLEDGQTTCLAM